MPGCSLASKRATASGPERPERKQWSRFRRSSPSTTTSSSRRTCGRTACPTKFKEIGPRLDRRKVKNMKFVGGVFSLRGGRRERRRHLVRLVADRGPPVPAHAAVGRGRLPARRDHGQPDHDGRHAQGLLGPEGAPRGHGRQPRRGVARVPDLPALLRPDVPRAQGQGARRPVREGLQRLDVRRVVRRHRTAG